MLSTSRLRSTCCALWILTVAPFVVRAEVAEPIAFELTKKSSWSDGCFPPCRCPIRFAEGVTGTFLLTFDRSDPLFEHYDDSIERFFLSLKDE